MKHFGAGKLRKGDFQYMDISREREHQIQGNSILSDSMSDFHRTSSVSRHCTNWEIKKKIVPELRA